MKVCSVESCEDTVSPKSARGMCSLHYRRFMAHGDVHKGIVPPERRFWSRVNKQGSDECWNWTSSSDRDGYGLMTDHAVSRSPIRAHRYSWMLHTGTMPASAVHVLHSCDNPPCVNPAHLFVGSNVDNIRDKITKGRGRGNRTGHLGDLKRRLTEDDIAAIRAYGNPYRGSRKGLAARYGISTEHVRRIQNGTRRA